MGAKNYLDLLVDSHICFVNTGAKIELCKTNVDASVAICSSKLRSFVELVSVSLAILSQFLQPVGRELYAAGELHSP